MQSTSRKTSLPVTWTGPSDGFYRIAVFGRNAVLRQRLLM
jgi:hypothetical protein